MNDNSDIIIMKDRIFMCDPKLLNVPISAEEEI